MKLFKIRQFFDKTFIHPEKRRTQILACIFLWSLLICVILQNWGFGMATIKGQSMYPTYREGDRRIFHKWIYLFDTPKRGDIVVVSDPLDNELAVKRVVALPGEKFLVKDEKVWIDDKVFDEPYLLPGVKTLVGKFDVGDSTIHLGEKEYIVLGDNRIVSRDSRIFGPLSKRRILGSINTNNVILRREASKNLTE